MTTAILAVTTPTTPETSPPSLAPDLFAAADGRLCQAPRAAAAFILQGVFEVFRSVIVRYLLARRDKPQRDEHDPALARYRLGVRPAGMVHITSQIPSRRSVDDPAAVELEHIFCAQSLPPVGFFSRNARTTIGGDVGGPLDGLRREETEPSGRTADAKRT